MNTTKTRRVIQNKSYYNLLPLVGLILDVKKEHLFDFKGIFVLNELHPELTIEDECLHILFEFREDINYDIIHSKFKHQCIVNEAQVDNFQYLYILRVPLEFSHEYQCFIDGKYSEYSDGYKKQLIRFHGYNKIYAKDGSEQEGDAVVDILYRREAAYIRQEKIINKELDFRDWTHIPRGQEIGKRWDENPETIKLETLTKELIKNENN